MPRTETEMLWHVKGEFSQSPPMWKQIRNTQERTLFMATAAKTTTKPAGTPIETGVSGSELWKLADTLWGSLALRTICGKSTLGLTGQFQYQVSIGYYLLQ